MPGTHTNLLYHLVFSTKQRKPFIEPRFRDDLYSYIGGVIRRQGGVLIVAGGMPDHIHLLTRLKPTIALSDVLRLIKANSSKWINDEKLKVRGFGWQDGYAAFTVSESQVTRVSRYIQNQERHHAKSDFKAELLALLKKNRIEYDEQYLWD